MAITIILHMKNGQDISYKSNIMKGYHVHKGRDRYEITEKRNLEQARLVATYPLGEVASVEEKRCPFCEKVNPTQRR